MSVRQTILDNLQTALEAIEDDTDYELSIAEVTPFDVSVLTADNHRFPLVMIVDAGPEDLIVRDASHYHFAMPVSLWGYVKTDTPEELQIDLNKMISALKQFVDSDPDLGSNACDFYLTGLESNILKTDKGIMGRTIITTRLRYWCAAGTF